jgi:hypothetical protein
MHSALRARLSPVPSFCETLFLLLNVDKLGHSMGTRHWRTLCLGTQVNKVDINAHAKFQLARMTVSRVTTLTNIGFSTPSSDSLSSELSSTTTGFEAILLL